MAAIESLSITVDKELKKVLRDQAKKNHRSLSKQAAYYIELGIADAKKEKQEKQE